MFEILLYNSFLVNRKTTLERFLHSEPLTWGGERGREGDSQLPLSLFSSIPSLSLSLSLSFPLSLSFLFLSLIHRIHNLVDDTAATTHNFNFEQFLYTPSITTLAIGTENKNKLF